MFNKKKDTAPGRAGRAPSPAPQVMINRRRSAGSVGARRGLFNNNTNIETTGLAHPGGAGAQNITGRLEANPTEGDNGGGTGDNQQQHQRRGLSNWVNRHILCVRSPENHNNASSAPTATHTSPPPQPAAAAVASRDPAAVSRRPHPVTIPSHDVPRTILDPPSPPATGVIHTPAGVSIIRQGDFGSELGHPIVAGYFSDGLRTPGHETPETCHGGEEQPHSHSDDFRLSPEPRQPESDAEDNERGRGRFRFVRRFYRPAASNNPTPAHSQSGSSRAGSTRNALKSLTALTPRRAPVPTSRNAVTRPNRHPATRDALERPRGPVVRRTQPIPTIPTPIPIPRDRRNALEVGRDGGGDLPEFHGRQRSATEPTSFVGPIRSQPVGAPFGAAGMPYQPRPFGTPYVAGSAITISTRSSHSSATITSIQTQPGVVFPNLGPTWTPPRPPTPNPAPAGPDVAGVATEAAATAFRTIAIDGPRKVYEFTVAFPGVRHGVVLVRWGIRGISFSFQWLRKHISPSPTPPPQQGSPELNVPATMQAPLVARGAVESAAGASSGGRATIKDDKGKVGKGNGGDKNAGGDKGKGNVGHGNGGKSGGDQGDGGKGGGGKDNRGKGNGEKEEDDEDEKDEDEDDDDDDRDESLSLDDDDEWTDIDTDTETDWSDCGEPVNSFLDSSSDEEAPLIPRGRGDGRRGGRR